MRALADPDEIRAAQEALRRHFAEGAQVLHEKEIGFQGGMLQAPVYWHPQHGIWGSINPAPPKEDAPQRSWNAFGTEDPTRRGSLSIVCEVNPAHAGVDRRVAGVFAKDEEGQTYLLHRGRLNGMTMEAFWREYEGQKVAVDEEQRPFAIVARIGSPSMIQEVTEFVKQARNIKLRVRGR